MSRKCSIRELIEHNTYLSNLRSGDRIRNYTLKSISRVVILKGGSNWRVFVINVENLIYIDISLLQNGKNPTLNRFICTDINILRFFYRCDLGSDN